MKFSKESLIKEFKNGCVVTDEKSLYRREIIVKSQMQQNSWELDNLLIGKIKITNIGKCYIILFPTLKSGLKEKIEHEITKSEYEELKSLYFGNFKPDYAYLKKWDKNA